jgi:hypothetical protein
MTTIYNLENNIFPKDLEKTLFSITDRQLVRTLQAHAIETCRNLISPEYIRKVFNRFKWGFLYKDEEGSILGFCLWKPIKETLKSGGMYEYTHLLLICAEENEFKLGKKMLYDLETHCIEKGSGSIRLEPVNERIEAYYTSLGYKGIQELPPYTMEKRLALEKYPEIPRKTRRKKSSKP